MTENQVDNEVDRGPEPSIAQAAAEAANPEKAPAILPPLRPCPCGQVPNRLILEMQRQAKYGNALGECCANWAVEFRNGFTADQEESVVRATEAWNAAPRAGD